MRVSPDQIELTGEVVEGLVKGFLYLKDENGSAKYPGALQALGVKWKVGQKVSITVKLADPAGLNPPTSIASENLTPASTGAEPRSSTRTGN